MSSDPGGPLNLCKSLQQGLDMGKLLANRVLRVQQKCDIILIVNLW